MALSPTTDRSRNDRRRQWLVYALWALVAFAFVRDQVFFQLGMARGKQDLVFWCDRSAEMAANPSLALYERYPRYLYPPFYLLLIRPLSFLPMWLAGFLFETAKWATLAGIIRMVSRLCARPVEKPRTGAAIAGTLLASRFISNDLSQGNVNLFIFATILAGCLALSRGRQVLAGFWVAVGTCIKVTPALVLIYFLYKRSWRTAIGAVAGGVLCLLVLPGLWLGWAENWNALLGWYRHVILSFVEQGDVYSTHINQSLTALLNRLFGTSVAIEPDVRIALTVLPWPVLNSVRLALMGLLVLVLAWICRGRLETARQPLAFPAEIALVLITMLLLSGYSWKAHFVTLMLAYSVLAAWWLERRPARRFVAVTTTASFCLCTLTSDLLTPRGADYAEACGLIAMGALVAALGIARVRGSLRTS